MQLYPLIQLVRSNPRPKASSSRVLLGLYALCFSSYFAYPFKHRDFDFKFRATTLTDGADIEKDITLKCGNHAVHISSVETSKYMGTMYKILDSSVVCQALRCEGSQIAGQIERAHCFFAPDGY